MSGHSSQKFQDHYALFNIDPKASSEVIQNAYTKLAQKYHPNNPDTGDQEKFESINLAYEVLSDLELRRSFDKLKGVDHSGEPKFSGLPFFEGLGRGTGLRSALLCVLYDRRRTRPFTPSLSLRHIENILSATEEEMTFALWYVKQRGLVLNDDKSNLQISVEGMDFLESHLPPPELIMPFMKPTGLEAGGAAAPGPAPAPSETAAAAASTLATLATALASPEEEPAAAPRFGARFTGMLKTPVAVR